MLLHSGLQAQGAQLQIPTNLELLKSLIVEVGMESVAGYRDLDFALHIEPAEKAFYFRKAVIAAFIDRGIEIISADSSVRTLHLSIQSAQVTYPQVWRSGMFGSRLLQRSVSVSIAAYMDPMKPGQRVLARELTKTYSDTIDVDDLHDVQNSSIPFTVGELPSEGFFSGIVEPLVFIGAIAVGIFLLFTVRS